MQQGIVYFGAKEKNTVTLPHSAQRKDAFLGRNKGNVKNKEKNLGRTLLLNCCTRD